MKKIDEEGIFNLAKELEKAKKEADKVNIGNLPIDDIHKLVYQNAKTNELINYILDYEK